MKIKPLVLVIGVLIGAITGSSLACTCEERDRKALFKKADWVFLAEITSTRLIKDAAAGQPETTLDGAQSFTVGSESADIVEASFTVIEYFKKGSTPIDVVRDLPYGFGNCSISLMSGMEYIFFVQKGQGALKELCRNVHRLRCCKCASQRIFRAALGATRIRGSDKPKVSDAQRAVRA